MYIPGIEYQLYNTKIINNYVNDMKVVQIYIYIAIIFIYKIICICKNYSLTYIIISLQKYYELYKKFVHRTY